MVLVMFGYDATPDASGLPYPVTCSSYFASICTAYPLFVDAPIEIIRAVGPDPEDQPPVISGTPPAQAWAGVYYEFIPEVTGGDSGGYEFSAEMLPSWADFDPNTGTLSGIPGADDIGTYDGIVIYVTEERWVPDSLPPFSIEVIMPGIPQIDTLTATPGVAGISEEILLEWTLSGGTPSALTLTSGSGPARDVLEENSITAIPFPSAAQEQWYKLKAVNAAAPNEILNPVWVRNQGGADSDAAYGVTFLSDGSLVVVSYFNGTATFGAGEPQQTALTSAGANDIAISRYSADGTFIWARRMGGAGNDNVWSVDSSADGNFFITGDFTGIAVFGEDTPNETVLTSGTGSIVTGFIAKFTSDGDLIWARQSTSTDSGVQSYGIAATSDGGVIAVGRFSGGSVTFGAGEPGETTLQWTPGGNFLLNSDIFVVRFGSDGALQWAFSLGGSVHEGSSSVAVTTDGEIVIGGSYLSPDFVLGSGESNETTLPSTGYLNPFIAKYSGDGELLWARSANGLAQSGGSNISTAADGAISLSGTIAGPITFGAGEPGETVLSPPVSNSMFLAKYSSDGTFLWVRQTGNAYPTSSGNRRFLPDGSILNCGSIGVGSAVFGTGEDGETTLFSASGGQAFWSKYSSGGDLEWVYQAHGTGGTGCRSLAIGPEGKIAAVGIFKSVTQFDGATMSVTTDTAGEFDGYVLLSQPPNVRYVTVKSGP